MTDLTFVRLTEIDPALIAAHMSDPRMAEHMPLLTGGWDVAAAEAFMAAKEACWTRDGLGHWAFLADGDYAGWGGFQKEGGDWDFGLVLCAGRFGLGPAIAKKALAFAREDPRIPFVTFLLPPTRRHLGALARLGARPMGETVHAGETFLKFRLETVPSIRLSGRLTCASAAEAAIVRDHLPEHVRLTRAEPGCLSFEVLPASEPLVWTVEELFRDRAAFEAHQARAQASGWGRATAGIARDYRITEVPGDS